MSLVLGVLKGAKVMLNTTVLNVLETSEDKQRISINIEGKTFLLNDKEFIEIMPTVFAAVGKPRYETTTAGIETLPRLALDAPRSIRITRDTTNVKSYVNHN